MKSKMLIFIVMLAAGAMMLTACGEESKESSATQSTTQSATQTTSSKDASKSAESKSDNSSSASEKKESSAASGNEGSGNANQADSNDSNEGGGSISKLQRRAKRNQVIPLRAARLRNPIRSRQSRSQSLPRTFPSFQPMNMSFRLFLRDK